MKIIRWIMSMLLIGAFVGGWLTIIFSILKACDVIKWSWVIVVLPCVIAAGCFMLAMFISALVLNKDDFGED